MQLMGEELLCCHDLCNQCQPQQSIAMYKIMTVVGHMQCICERIEELL